uniref:Uncharacterized protein n=1 Tax=Bicosoecida sp. CB-2014 TaxID=1486930 RepID=A0A7S1CNJ5_9STRA|mmetsp:Transcript_7259/g.25943  ORF Transcript_7259/g.25943 Transcript_7259/m.25943 type:complete len:360 (+) Transcript_7259:216-1295(+)
MGCSGSKPSVKPGDAGTDVDAEMAAARAIEEATHKVLLLGAGEGGKTTFLKQLRVTYAGGIPPEEYGRYINAVRGNTMECARALLGAVDKFELRLEPTAVAARATIEAVEEDAAAEPAVVDALARLWADPAVKQAYERRSEYWLLDACPYYMENAARAFDPLYTPGSKDILLTRVRSTGIVRTEFEADGRRYRLVDVGGQRNERRKWINCFDNMDAIIYFVSLAEYDQVLFEDATQNRMQESLELLEKTLIMDGLQPIKYFYVFFSKYDIFESMIKHTSLKVCYPDYDGPAGDAAHAEEFIRNKVRAIFERSRPQAKVTYSSGSTIVREEVLGAFKQVQDFLSAVKGDAGGAPAAAARV